MSDPINNKSPENERNVKPQKRETKISGVN